MKNFQEQRTFMKFMHSKLGLFLFTVFVLFFSWNVIKFLVKDINTTKNKNIAADKVIELEKEKERLTTDINTLNTDAGVEATIRNKFGLAKEGEGLVVVVNEKDTALAQPTQHNAFLDFFRNLVK